MRALLVVDVDATIKIYFKRAPFYNAFIRIWGMKQGVFTKANEGKC
jgi:hypothetical protein